MTGRWWAGPVSERRRVPGPFDERLAVQIESTLMAFAFCGRRAVA